MARYKRHPADVTADRLGDHYSDFYDLMDGRERDDLSHTIDVLRQIAEGERGPIPRRKPPQFASR